MILKSYILEQSFQSIDNYKLFLFYGENQGLKKEFKEKLNTLNIKKMSDYRKYCVSGKRDERMPTNPLTIYGRKYNGIRWRDFLLLH